MSKVTSIDPGVSGGISIFEDDSPIVFSVPTKKYKINKKNKTDYDIYAMADLIKSHLSVTEDNIFIIEDVHCSVGNGSVSMFNFGRGKGIWEGIACALGMKIIYISPQKWKKGFTELETKEIKETRDEIKKLKEENKKDKNKKKENSKIIKKLSAKIKTTAKSAARDLASKLYPKISDSFKLKKDDGKAESLLIGLYAKKNLIELIKGE